MRASSRIWICLGLLLASAGPLLAQTTNLPGTKPLTMQGDISAQMVAGVDRFLMEQTELAAKERSKYWERDFSARSAYENSIQKNRDRLKYLIGATDEWLPFVWMEFLGNTPQGSTIYENSRYRVHAVRWPVLPGVHGEGLWIEPKGKPRASVIAIPDADQTPEMLAGLSLGIATEAQFARRLAEAGFEVFVPVLINRSDALSGNEELKRYTNQPHREWIYRQAYELGRHVIGYEVEKVLALVQWLQVRGQTVGIAGYGEGGLIGFYASALAPTVRTTLVSGYFGPRERLWEEPIYRNVFDLVREFGDAEIASMIAPRSLIIEYSETPQISGPPKPHDGRTGAAPGRIWTPERHEVEQEFNRAREFFPANFKTDFRFVSGNGGTTVLPGSDQALGYFAEALGESFEPATAPKVPEAPPELRLPVDIQERQKQQVKELVDHIQHELVVCERYRNEHFWKPLANLNASQWAEKRQPIHDKFWDEVLGGFASPQTDMNPRSRLIYDAPKYTGYEVALDVWPDVFAWGILLVPKDLKPGDKRPVVVCQHGLEGVPKDTIEGPGSNGYGPYKAFTARLAEQGFITFAPHNPYRGQDKFRVLQRKSNPLGRTLFSTIIGQHEQILNWLQALPFVDPQRIGFYGLSYGGKSAMRIPSVLDRYALSICSADFNDWVKKCATVDSAYSYIFGGEYDMPEWDLGHRFNYSEMAALVAPRPFMVERGHGDGVAPDEWVAYEFAKVQRFYDQLGIGDRTQIEFFNGPHTINGKGTFEFLHQHLRWPN